MKNLNKFEDKFCNACSGLGGFFAGLGGEAKNELSDNEVAPSTVDNIEKAAKTSSTVAEALSAAIPDNGDEALADAKGRLANIAKGLGHVEIGAKAVNAFSDVQNGTKGTLEAIGEVAGEEVAGKGAAAAVGLAVGVATKNPSVTFIAATASSEIASPYGKEIGGEIGKAGDQAVESFSAHVSEVDRDLKTFTATAISEGLRYGGLPDFSNLFRYPILVDLEGDGVQFSPLGEESVHFDSDKDGFEEHVAWVGPKDGILVTDLDGDGTVSDVDEFLIANRTAADDTDLEALATLHDSNGDGVLDANDADYGSMYSLSR